MRRTGLTDRLGRTLQWAMMKLAGGWRDTPETEARCMEMALATLHEWEASSASPTTAEDGKQQCAGIRLVLTTNGGTNVGHCACREEVARLREREAHFAKVLNVTDAGQYRADWDSAISRVVAERDALRAQLADAEADREEYRKTLGTVVPQLVRVADAACAARRAPK